MQVRRARGIEGARGARGTVVVIDVLRAFTTAACAFAAGTERIELVATPEEALALKAKEPELVLVGEVGGRPIAGFDHGNSPERMLALDLRGQTVILRSSSGVQGALVAARTGRSLFLGSFVTAAATVRAIRARSEDVTLLAMGASGTERGLDGPEDDVCAELLAARLAGEAFEWGPAEARVRGSPSAHAALDPSVDWISPGDLACALALDRFDFAIEARVQGERLVAFTSSPSDRRRS
jgi:2-phosphosulfolactate phosphatase